MKSLTEFINEANDIVFFKKDNSSALLGRRNRLLNSIDRELSKLGMKMDEDWAYDRDRYGDGGTCFFTIFRQPGDKFTPEQEEMLNEPVRGYQFVKSQKDSPIAMLALDDWTFFTPSIGTKHGLYQKYDLKTADAITEDDIKFAERFDEIFGTKLAQIFKTEEFKNYNRVVTLKSAQYYKKRADKALTDAVSSL